MAPRRSALRHALPHATLTPRPRVLCWGLLLAQAACIEPVWAPPDPIPVALLTPDVWSGGEAVLASAAFSLPQGLPVVLLNDDTLVVRRLDDTTVAARLPDLPGTQVLRVLAPDVLDLPITVELRGFESAGRGPLLSGRLQVLPGWPPAVLGSGGTGAVLWNLQSTITMPLPDGLHDPTCVRGVGPSYGTLRITLAARCEGTRGFARWWAWRVRPRVEQVEDTLCAGSDRFVAALAPGVSVSVAHHDVFGYVRADTTCLPVVPFVRAEETYDIVLSPRGDRAVIAAGNYAPLDGSPSLGVPVLDAATGQVAYTVEPILRAPTAAFSADGDTLWVAGTGAPGEAQLAVVRAGDGAILRLLEMPFVVTAVAPDPSRRWLYIAGFSWPARRGQLLVLERGSLGVVTTLSAADSIDGFWAFGYGARLVPSPAEQRVYVVWTSDLYSVSNRPIVTRFRTPP